MLGTHLRDLGADIETARKSYIDSVSNLSKSQANFETSPGEWSIVEITEHLTWAEQIGICGMFNAVEGLRNGQPTWKGVSPNAGLSIEEIVEKTWAPKEKVPKVAEPKWGGSLKYWICNLNHNASLLNDLLIEAQAVDLTQAIYPHPISGPMNVIQRLEFLRFHLDRHRGQVERIKSNSEYLSLP